MLIGAVSISGFCPDVKIIEAVAERHLAAIEGGPKWRLAIIGGI